MENKFNPKKNKQDRRPRLKRELPAIKWINGRPTFVPNPPGQNRKERRLLKARERILPSFSKREKARLHKQIQENERKESVKRRLIKSPKKPKVPFVSKRSQRVWAPGKHKK